MPERGRSELNFRAGEATDVRVASRNAQSRKWSTTRAANARWYAMEFRPESNSRSHVIDHDVNESVVTDPIRDLAEWIAAARQRIA
jgi:hypothetical protein